MKEKENQRERWRRRRERENQRQREAMIEGELKKGKEGLNYSQKNER